MHINVRSAVCQSFHLIGRTTQLVNSLAFTHVTLCGQHNHHAVDFKVNTVVIILHKVGLEKIGFGQLDFSEAPLTLKQKCRKSVFHCCKWISSQSGSKTLLGHLLNPKVFFAIKYSEHK